MDAAAHTELATLVTRSEEGFSTDEVVSPTAVSGRATWLRRAGLAALGLAGFVLFATAMTPNSKQSSDSMAAPDFTTLLESSAKQALGRSLTGQEHKTLREEFNGAIAQARNLDAEVRNLGDTLSTGSASAECQHDFAGHILKAVARVGAAGLKVALSCLAPDSDGCTTAKAEAAQLTETMKNECVEEPSTDICQQSGSNMETVDVCIPKTCQNADDLGALAKGDTSISCGGGGLAGLFKPIMGAMHLR